MRWKTVTAAVMAWSQLIWIGLASGGLEYSTKYAINYDPDLANVASYWANSTWNPHEPADNWMRAEDGTVTLYYKANRTDWGNTEVYQGKKPAFNIEKSLRFRDFLYKEGSAGLSLLAKVRRDIDPVWQGTPLSLKSPYPQANIGLYLWLEVQGWNYDDWAKTSSLVIDVYFDSRYQNQTSMETEIRELGWSYPPTTTPYDPQIHAGYVVGTLPLNSWQEFNVNIGALIDQTLQECRDEQIALPSNEVFIKFLGVYVDSFSAAVQASFDYVLLKDTTSEETCDKMKTFEEKLNSISDQIARLRGELASVFAELENIRNIMYAFMAAAIALLATTLYLVIKKPKREIIAR